MKNFFIKLLKLIIYIIVLILLSTLADNTPSADITCYILSNINEYSFLVFEGCDLFYIDEFGESHETEIV